MSLQMHSIKWILILVFLSGCEGTDGTAPSNTPRGAAEHGLMSVNVNRYAAHKIMCDPLTTPVSSPIKSYQNGIKAELFYRTQAMPRWYSSLDYVSKAKKSEQNVFLTNVNVPTRMFTEGFTTTQGQTLKDDQQNKLIEYFGLKMSSNLMLSDEDEAGYYEFALLSDDGATLKIKSKSIDQLGTVDEIIIDNEGDHPTKMGCSTSTVRMIKNVMYPIELTYYQGPRFHISNVLLWRKSSVSGQDSLCNAVGNNLFFNPEQNSAPQPAFTTLMSRGWKVLKPKNFVISETNVDYNPCVQGTNPVISHFEPGEVVLSSASFSWHTDIPATSQILLTNIATGETQVTNSDNILRVQHQVVLQDLLPRTDYKAQVLSISADLGRAIGPEFYFTTQ